MVVTTTDKTKLGLGSTHGAMMHFVSTIFGGPETGDTTQQRKKYARAGYDGSAPEYVNLTQHFEDLPKTPYTEI